MSGPDVWGPHGWKFIHYIMLAYPEKPTAIQKQHYLEFFTLLKYVIPCHVCAKHYEENLKNLPINDIVLSSRENMVKWSIDIHNLVNESKNKPILDYEEAYKMINTDTKCPINIVEDFDNIQNLPKSETSINEKDHTVFYLIGIVFVLIGIAIIYKKK